MACKIQYNEDGTTTGVAPNGNESILYRDMISAMGDPDKKFYELSRVLAGALTKSTEGEDSFIFNQGVFSNVNKLYLFTNSTVFKDKYEGAFDDNGEPVFDDMFKTMFEELPSQDAFNKTVLASQLDQLNDYDRKTLEGAITSVFFREEFGDWLNAFNDYNKGKSKLEIAKDYSKLFDEENGMFPFLNEDMTLNLKAIGIDYKNNIVQVDEYYDYDELPFDLAEDSNPVESPKEYLSFLQRSLRFHKQRLFNLYQQKPVTRQEKHKITSLIVFSREKIDEVEEQIKQALVGKADRNTINDGVNEILKSLQNLVEIIENNSEGATKIDIQEYAQEAMRIGSFLKRMGIPHISKYKAALNGHPLLEIDQIYDENGTVILPIDEAQFYESVAEQAERLIEKIDKITESNMIDTLYNTALARQYFESKEELEKLMSLPLRDATWIDMAVMDIAAGIFTDNGVIPQLSRFILESAFDKAGVSVRNNIQLLNEILPKLRKELGEDGFEVFIAKDKKGRRVRGTSLVQYFTTEFEDKVELLKSKLALKEKFSGNPHDIINNFFENEADIIDGVNLPEIIADEDIQEDIKAFEEALGVKLNKNKLEPEAYKAELINKIGEFNYNKIVESQKKKIRNARAEVAVLIDNGAEKAKALGTKEVNIKDYYKMVAIRLFPSLIDFSSNGKLKSDKLGILIHNVDFIPKKAEDYDNNFKSILANDTLHIFYDIAANMTQKAFEAFDDDVRSSLTPASIMSDNKTILETWRSGDHVWSDFLSKISQSWGNLIDELKSFLSFVPQGPVESRALDEDNQPIKTVNSSFISNQINRVKFISRSKISIIESLVGKGKDNFGVPTTVQLTYKGETYVVSRDMILAGRRMLRESGANITESAAFEAAAIEIGKRIAELEGESVTGSQAISFYDKYRISRSNPDLNIRAIKLEADKYARNEVTKNTSSDLPKLLRLYSTLAAEHKARRDVTPIIRSMHKKYKEIKKISTNNVDEEVTAKSTDKLLTTEKRSRALIQYESWIEQNVFDRKEIKKYYGVMGKKPSNNIEDPETKSLIKKLGINNLLNTKDFWETREDKEAIELIKEFKKVNPDVYDMAKSVAQSVISGQDLSSTQADFYDTNVSIVDAIMRYEMLGKRTSASSILRGISRFIVYKALGWNISSVLTNFFEGQISTFINAGLYYPAEYQNQISNARFIRARMRMSMNMDDKAPEDAWIVLTLADKYDKLQDIRQQLQKASDERKIASFERLQPLEPQVKSEKLTQISTFGAILRDTKIYGTDQDGNTIESNVLHAFERVVEEDSQGRKRYVARLKPEFATEKNKANWEREVEPPQDAPEGFTDDYELFSSRVNEVLMKLYGDYAKTSNAFFKQSAEGQAIMSMLSWLPRELYKRYGVQQLDLLSGLKLETDGSGKKYNFKGRYRSMTNFQAGLMFGMGAFAFAGLPGAIAAGGIATLINNRIKYKGGMGVGSKMKLTDKIGFAGVESQMGVAQELALHTNFILKRMLGIPVRLLTRVVAKDSKLVKSLNNDKVINLLKSTEKGKIVSESIYQSVQLEGSEIDKRNYVANMRDMTIMLMTMLVGLVIKSVFSDDEDEEVHNILINKNLQLLEQSTSYMNPFSFFDTLSKFPALRFMTEFTEFVKSVGHAFGGDSVYTSGPHSGEYKVWHHFGKFALPSVSRSFGVGAAKEKQFTKTIADSWFESDIDLKADETKQQRANYRKQLREKGVQENLIRKLVDIKHPYHPVIQARNKFASKLKKAGLSDEEATDRANEAFSGFKF